MITSFGLGYCRPASGTWGSLPPAVVAGALAVLPGGGVYLPGGERAWVFYLLMAVFVVVFSWACVARGDEAELHFGKKDPGQVVADETAGMALTLCALPWFATGAPVLVWVAGAFVLFRIADILKLWPANGLQAVPGGWGILLDDLVAGVQAGVLLLVVALPMRAGMAAAG